MILYKYIFCYIAKTNGDVNGTILHEFENRNDIVGLQSLLLTHHRFPQYPTLSPAMYQSLKYLNLFSSVLEPEISRNYSFAGVFQSLETLELGGATFTMDTVISLLDKVQSPLKYLYLSYTRKLYTFPNVNRYNQTLKRLRLRQIGLSTLMVSDVMHLSELEELDVRFVLCYVTLSSTKSFLLTLIICLYFV